MCIMTDLFAFTFMPDSSHHFQNINAFLASVCPCPPWFANGTIQGTYNWTSTSPPDCKYDDSERYYGTIIDYQCPYGYKFDYNGDENLLLKCETWADWHPAGPPNCIRKLHQLFSHVFFSYM